MINKLKYVTAYFDRAIVPGARVPFTGKGGVFQRVQKSFFGTQRASAEFGQEIGGAPGRVAGTFIGSAIGGASGVFEATFGTLSVCVLSIYFS